MYAAYDSIRQDSKFEMNLFSNEKFYSYYLYGYYWDLYIPTITIEHKPDWLSSDSSGFLYSTDTDIARKLVYQDPAQCSVVLLLDDGWGNVATQTIQLQTAAMNNKPALMLSDSIICENSLFSAYVTSTDGDVYFGDTNYYAVLQKPAWLNYEIKNDTVYLFGIPLGDHVNGLTRQDSLLRIIAIDTKNESTTTDFLIHITPHVRILSATKDTAVVGQYYSYSIVVDNYGKDIFISFLNIPQWLHMDEPNHFSGIPDIHNLNDTILRFVTLDVKECKTYAEHEIIINIIPEQVTSAEITDTPFARVYPNPTGGMLTLQFEATSAYIVTITDVAGKILLRQSVNDQTVQVDISNYPAGLYLVTIDDGKRKQTTRIVKN
jgi:hypothetical protein